MNLRTFSWTGRDGLNRSREKITSRKIALTEFGNKGGGPSPPKHLSSRILVPNLDLLERGPGIAGNEKYSEHGSHFNKTLFLNKSLKLGL